MLGFSRKQAHRNATFYCRWSNQFQAACPQAGGPEACPLRRECAAYRASLAGDPASPAARTPHAQA